MQTLELRTGDVEDSFYTKKRKPGGYVEVWLQNEAEKAMD